MLGALEARTSTARHAWGCWRVLALLLLRLRAHDVVFTVPRLLALQDALTTAPVPHAPARWAVLLAYLRLAAALLGCADLRALAKTAAHDARARGATCPELTLHGDALVYRRARKGARAPRSTDTAAPLAVTVPRERVVALLCSVPAVQHDYPNARAILNGDAEPALPEPVVVPAEASSSVTADSAGGHSAGTPSSSGATTPAPAHIPASRTASRAGRGAGASPAAAAQGHDALRYEALIRSIYDERTRGSAESEGKGAQEIDFSQLLALAQQYQQETDQCFQAVLAVVDGNNKNDAPSDADERIKNIIIADGSGEHYDIDWNAYVEEKQHWPHIPQLPMF